MPAPDPKRPRRRLFAALKGRAYDVLAGLPDEVAAKPVTVTVTDKAWRVGLTVGPAADGADAAEGALPDVGGLMFSAVESLIVRVLLADGCVEGRAKAMLGKQVAAKIGQPYEAKLKHCLQNLEDRLVVRHVHAEGYRVVPRRPADRGRATDGGGDDAAA